MADDRQKIQSNGKSKTSDQLPAESTAELPVPVETPPATPPPLTQTVQEHQGRRWPVILLYLVAAFIVAALIVLGVRAIYHATHKSNPAPQTTSGTSMPAEPNSSNSSGGNSNSSNNTNNSSSSSHPKTSPNTGAQVPNTGPGNTVGLFVLVSLTAAILHNWRQRKNANL